MSHIAMPASGVLHAHSFPIDPPGELLDHVDGGGFAWLHDGEGFVTSGAVATVAAADAPALLGAVGHVRDTGTPPPAGPRAVGALPFDGDGLLRVPAITIGIGATGAWCTVVDANEPAPQLHVAAVGPRLYSVQSLVSEEEWHARVASVLRRIHDGRVRKVVLARAVDIEADAPIDQRSVLAQLRRTQPGCVVYADGGFIGASPELLVRVHGPDVVARPLAGTGTDVERLTASRKDAHEHRVVVDAVVDALMKSCDDVGASGPAPLAFGDIVHLATTVFARRRDDTTIIDLVRALHPTPAVAGDPRALALACIRELEPTPRGRYAGPCGWVDADGNGAFVVALRGGEINDNRARLHAGAGIVAGSDAAAEWTETQQKLEPMLRAIIRP